MNMVQSIDVPIHPILQMEPCPCYWQVDGLPKKKKKRILEHPTTFWEQYYSTF